MSAAIVSTTKEFTEDHNYFIRHHVGIGIKRFYFFLDDPRAEMSKERLKPNTDAHISIFVRGHELETAWAKIPTFDEYKTDIDRLVVKRQALNVRLAEELAIKENITWLFHIDDDELLLPLGWKNINDYLYFLPQEVVQITALNLEPIYQQDQQDGIFVRNLEFKKNPYLMSGSQLELIKDNPKEYFYCSYAHGKSGLRVSSLNGIPTIPAGVHLFYERAPETYFQSSPFDLVLLHFPFSGSDKLFEKFNGINSQRIYQYEQLASKGEKNFYTEARQLKNKDAFKKYYEEHVLFHPDEIDFLRKHNLIFAPSLEY
jgi:hypothetical protein